MEKITFEKIGISLAYFIVMSFMIGIGISFLYNPINLGGKIVGITLFVILPIIVLIYCLIGIWRFKYYDANCVEDEQ